MRRSSTLATILALALALVALGVTACGDDDDDGGGGGNGGGAPAADTGEQPASDYRVALLTTGALNNRSWANSWADGAKKARDELGVELEMVGNADAPDQYVSQGSQFASQGYDLLIFAHGAMHDPAVRVAKQFPDVQIVQVFQHASEEEASEDPPNLGHVDPEQGEVTFLAGILAGLMTESNTIGSVYAFPFPALTRQPEAFELGARCVNSEIEHLQRQSDSFTDAAAARAAASTVMDRGADFVLSAVDQAVQGVIQAASQAQSGGGVGPFAVASYFDSNDLNPDAVITSALYGLDAIAYDVIERGAKGELGEHFAQSYTLDTQQGGSLAPFYEQEELIGKENIDRLEQVREMIVDKTITVPDEIVSNPDVAGGATIGEPGAAKKIDVADIGCDDQFRSDLGL